MEIEQVESICKVISANQTPHTLFCLYASLNESGEEVPVHYQLACEIRRVSEFPEREREREREKEREREGGEGREGGEVEVQEESSVHGVRVVFLLHVHIWFLCSIKVWMLCN